MNAQSLGRGTGSRMLASGKDFALLAAIVPGLANPLLVQVYRSSFGTRPAYSIYALYRTGRMSFDVTVRVTVADPLAGLEALLRGFVAGRDFERAVIDPLTRQMLRSAGA